jgi:hypothetical protein
MWNLDIDHSEDPDVGTAVATNIVTSVFDDEPSPKL